MASHFTSAARRAVSDWSEDNAPGLAAELAFYTMLSIAPLLIILIKIVGAVFGQKAAQGQIVNYIREFVGERGAVAVQDMIANAGRSGSGVLATIISTAVLILGATGVFGALQQSLDAVFNVKPRPGRGISGTLRDRLFSFAMVMVIAFLLLVSLVASAVLSAATRYLGGANGIIWQAVNLVVSFGVVTLLFALIFKYVPDVKIRWRHIWPGAILTAVLFTIGKFLLGWYLGRGTTTSVYGAAGSLVALLLWVYYSAQIMFFGAEFIQAYARDGVAPADHALPADEPEVREVVHERVVHPAARGHGMLRSTLPLALGWAVGRTMGGKTRRLVLVRRRRVVGKDEPAGVPKGLRWLEGVRRKISS